MHGMWISVRISMITTVGISIITLMKICIYTLIYIFLLAAIGVVVMFLPCSMICQDAEFVHEAMHF